MINFILHDGMTYCPVCGSKDSIKKLYAFGKDDNSIIFMCNECKHYHEKKVNKNEEEAG